MIQRSDQQRDAGAVDADAARTLFAVGQRSVEAHRSAGGKLVVDPPVVANPGGAAKPVGSIYLTRVIVHAVACVANHRPQVKPVFWIGKGVEKRTNQQRAHRHVHTGLAEFAGATRPEGATT